MEKKLIKILYTNWKNETRYRIIEPVSIEFKSTKWHPEQQWLLNALDVETGEPRAFTIKDIKEWHEVE